MFGIQLLAYDIIKKILQQAIINNKVASAYCFVGPEGVGKDAMALEFAKALNCRNLILENGSATPCNSCKSCKMADSFEHPNIMYVFALPSGKKSDSDNPVENLSDDQIAEIQEQLSEKAVNPYSQITVSGANNIKINQIRYLKKKLSLSASTEGKRCIIISKAERMTEEAANAFLKTLEEPHPDTTIIMTSSRKEALLQTIVSRCQTLNFNPIPDEDVAAYLKVKYGLDELSSRTVSAFAQGSVSTALDYMHNDIKELRDEIIDMLRTAAKNTYRDELIKKINAVAAEKDKAKVKLFLKMLYVWVRDTYLMDKDVNDSMLINYDVKDTIKKFSDYFNNGNYSETIKCIEEAIRQVDINVAPQLILTNLFIKLRQVYLRK